MAQLESPVIQQRRLRAELRRAREQAGQTQREVADALDWSPSKLIRIEAGANVISTTDLMALLQHYGVTDRKRVNELVNVARASRKQAWWDQYRAYYPQQFLTFLGYEASAMRLRTYQALVIPGLLQTRDYSLALMQSTSSDREAISRGVEVRLKRQDLLDAEPGPEMFFVLDEAVIHRLVGGPDVMRRQLLRLEELDKRPNINIQVLPFAAGAHPGMRGAFTVFEFPYEEEDYAVLLEHAHRDVLVQNDPEQTSTYVETFFELEALATPKGELRKITRQVIDQLPGGDPIPPADEPGDKARVS
jgi:transcriptional regulator with XRE-family HTH domain